MSDYNLEAEKKNKADQEKDKREHDQRISDLRKILSTPEGRRGIWNELSRAKIFIDFFSLNSFEVARFLGQRSIGLGLLADLMEAKPASFYQMYCEAISKEKGAKKEEEPNE